MFRSQPIPMMTEGRRLSAVKLAALYKYKNDGLHNYIAYPPEQGADDSENQLARSLCIKLYGINKTGTDTLIAKCYLDTIIGYTDEEYAASIITGIPVYEFPAIYYTYDTNENQQVVGAFDRLLDLNMFVEISILPDVLESDNYAYTT